jgi:hypothetical protein
MSTTHQYLSGTLASDPIGSVSPRGTPGVKFTLRKEPEDEGTTALSFWCFVAELWPTILGCRKGDALSVVARLGKRSGIPHNGNGADFMVRQVLSVRKPSSRTSHETLPEAI